MMLLLLDLLHIYVAASDLHPYQVNNSAQQYFYARDQHSSWFSQFKTW